MAIVMRIFVDQLGPRDQPLFGRMLLSRIDNAQPSNIGAMANGP
jgi:hypothetical protein